MMATSPRSGGGGGPAPMSPLSPSSAELSASLAAKKRRRWTAKYHVSQRYAAQYASDPAFFAHSKHIFICSWSGRPIYTRYGDESRLAAYIGVITALIENFRRINGGVSMNVVTAGVYTIVFRCVGPIYLIAISRTGESVAALTAQLDFAYKQILSVLTGSVTTMLEQRPQYDVRNLLAGTESLLSDLISESDRSFCALLNGIHCLPLPKQLRNKVGAALRKGSQNATKSLIYGILITNTHLIHVVRGKDRVLHPSDLFVLVNFLRNSQSLQSAESWTPICLESFFARGFVYAYVSYITDDLCLCMITADPNDFHQLRTAKQSIVEQLQRKSCIDDLLSFVSHPNITLDELDFVSISELKHFIYRNEQNNQIVVAAAAPPYNVTQTRRALFRRYQHVYGKLERSDAGSTASKSATTMKRVTVYWDVNALCAMFAATKIGEYSIVATFTPNVNKAQANDTTNRIIKWIHKESGMLFV